MFNVARYRRFIDSIAGLPISHFYAPSYLSHSLTSKMSIHDRDCEIMVDRLALDVDNVFAATRLISQGFIRITGEKKPFIKPVGVNYVKDAEELREFECPICHETAWRPRLLSCGHTFCSDCLETALTHQNGKSCCPYCRTELPIDFDAVIMDYKPSYAYKQLDKEIVVCSNEGCGEPMERFLLVDHLIRHCPYTEHECSDPTCDRFTIRKHWDRRGQCVHTVRQCPRSACGATLERWQEEEHEKVCAALNAACPSCGQIFSRAEIARHQEDCSSTMPAKCSGHAFGCRFAGPPPELAAHEADCAIVPLGRVIGSQQALLRSYSDALHQLAGLGIEQRFAATQARLDAVSEQLTALAAGLRPRLDRADRLRADVDDARDTLRAEIPALHVQLLNMDLAHKHAAQLVDASLARLASETSAQWDALDALRRASNAVVGPPPPPPGPLARQMGPLVPFGPAAMHQQMHHMQHAAAFEAGDAPNPMPQGGEGGAGGGVAVGGGAGDVPHVGSQAGDAALGMGPPPSSMLEPAGQQMQSELVNALLIPPPSGHAMAYMSPTLNRRSSSPQRGFSRQAPFLPTGPFPRRRSSAERSTKL